MKERQVEIIPIKKQGDTYILEVNKSLWNEIQVLLLKGASKEEVTLEFQYEKV